MTSRMTAAILGLIAGIALFFAVALSWNGMLSAVGLDHAMLLTGLTGAAKAAWAVSGGIAAFAVVASLAALAGGIAETAKLRRRIDELRLDPAVVAELAKVDLETLLSTEGSELGGLPVQSVAIAVRGALDGAVGVIMRDPDFDAVRYGEDVVAMFGRIARRTR